MNRLLRRVLGGDDLRAAGLDRTWRGAREGDQGQLLFGLTLAALSWLRRTRPRRRLLYRKAVPAGSAVVVHHRRRGDPRIEVIKPD